MARYTGGTQVKGGYYWNPRNWEVKVVPQEGGRLEGSSEARYLKIPFPLLFLVVPVLGGLFLIFLPLIGFALFGWAIVKKLSGGVKQTATELASTVTPGGFAAGEAHFTGKPGEGKGEGKGEAEGEAKAQAKIEELAREIEERKGERK